MAQTWEELLFVHWPVDAEQIRPHLPDGLELDSGTGRLARDDAVPADGPACARDAAAPGPLQPARDQRADVRDARRQAGIWFFSLDATSRAAVEAARARTGSRTTSCADVEERGLDLRWRSSRIDARVRTCSRRPIARRACSGRARARSRSSSPSATASTPRIAARCTAPRSTTRRGRSSQPSSSSTDHDGARRVRPARRRAARSFSARQDVVCWRLERA